MALLTTNFYTDALTVLLCLTTIIIVYFKKSYTYWPKRGVHCIPPEIPFGNMKEIVLQKTNFGLRMAQVYQKLKPLGLRYGGFYFMASPIFVPIDPELIKNIMVKEFNNFTDHGNYTNEEVDPMSGNLFSLRGNKWKSIRAKITPTLTPGKMKMMFQTLVDCSKELISFLDNVVGKDKVVDMKDCMSRFTIDVIGSCGFGIECNSFKQSNSDFEYYGKKVFQSSFAQGMKAVIGFVAPSILDAFKISIIARDVNHFFIDLIQKTIEYREKHNVFRKDFVHLLIQLKNNVAIQENEDGKLKNENGSGEEDDGFKSLSVQELAAQSFIFFLAGYETSSTTISFCLFELATNQEIQEKLREEVNRVLKEYNGEISYEAISEMSYMDKCVHETLRKHPAVPILTRECNAPYKVPGSELVIEKGVLVFIPTMGLHHDPEFYPDPNKFDPERFSAKSKAERHPFTFLPFGEGPRICLGVRFGIMQVKTALTLLLKRYRFTLNEKTMLPLEMDPKCIVLSVEKGIWLNVDKIE